MGELGPGTRRDPPKPPRSSRTWPLALGQKTLLQCLCFSPAPRRLAGPRSPRPSDTHPSSHLDALEFLPWAPGADRKSLPSTHACPLRDARPLAHGMAKEAPLSEEAFQRSGAMIGWPDIPAERETSSAITLTNVETSQWLLTVPVPLEHRCVHDWPLLHTSTLRAFFLRRPGLVGCAGVSRAPHIHAGWIKGPGKALAEAPLPAKAQGSRLPRQPPSLPTWRWPWLFAARESRDEIGPAGHCGGQQQSTRTARLPIS